MISTAVTLLVGAFVGWTVPQPQWAKAVQAKVTSSVASWFVKKVV